LKGLRVFCRKGFVSKQPSVTQRILVELSLRVIENIEFEEPKAKIELGCERRVAII